MNRNITSALAMGSVTIAAVAAALVSANAFADDITIDPTPFVSTRTRAEVQAELKGPAAVIRANDEWTLQDNQPHRLMTGYTSDQAKAEYKASRQYVRAVTGEDSGSAFFIKSGDASRAAAVMGGPARN